MTGGHDDVMKGAIPSHLIPYAVGVLLLGVVGFAFGEFALQWQPVPKELPGRAPLAYLGALLLMSGGVAMLMRPIAARAALAMGGFFALWAVSLHGPRLLAAPNVVIHWNGFAEITAIAAGGVIGWALPGGDVRVSNIARRIFGACFAVFGIAHFVYADFTADMVPSWMPARLFWAYMTGVGHIAASLSLLSNRRTALASTLLTAMLASFVILLHIPRVIANPSVHIEWVMLAISMTLTGAAWIVRASTIRERNKGVANISGASQRAA